MFSPVLCSLGSETTGKKRKSSSLSIVTAQAAANTRAVLSSCLRTGELMQRKTKEKPDSASGDSKEAPSFQSSEANLRGTSLLLALAFHNSV